MGLSLRLNYSKPSGGTGGWGYGAGPFLRYYFLPTDKLVNIFSEAGYVYESVFGDSNYSHHTNNIGLKAGAVVFFTGSVALEVTLNYDYSIYDSADSKKIIDNLFSLGVGFQVHLKKKD